jgi:hypothetical protein
LFEVDQLKQRRPHGLIINKNNIGDYKMDMFRESFVIYLMILTRPKEIKGEAIKTHVGGNKSIKFSIHTKEIKSSWHQ